METNNWQPPAVLFPQARTMGQLARMAEREQEQESRFDRIQRIDREAAEREGLPFPDPSGDCEHPIRHRVRDAQTGQPFCFVCHEDMPDNSALASSETWPTPSPDDMLPRERPAHAARMAEIAEGIRAIIDDENPQDAAPVFERLAQWADDLARMADEESIDEPLLPPDKDGGIPNMSGYWPNRTGKPLNKADYHCRWCGTWVNGEQGCGHRASEV